MRIRLLGTAAGGGVPQWNCGCPVCRDARKGNGRVRVRTQSCVAVSADDEAWFLLNASPDLRTQIESFAPLQPCHETRNSPIEAVLLTNADLDHTLGLFLLREGQRIRVHASAAMRAVLNQGLNLGPVLDSFCGVDWIEPPTEWAPLRRHDGTESGLWYQAVRLGGRPPRYARVASQEASGGTGIVVSYRLMDRHTGGQMFFAPEIAAGDEAVIHRVASECQLVLLDGTFWSETEMQQRGVGSMTAAQMGHWPISGPGGSLELLKRIQGPRRIYIHLNNTNPVLFEDSAERAEVLAAGCEIGEDGLDLRV